MMTVFAAAIDDLFADPDLARSAMWREGGLGAPVSVRIVLRRPDRSGTFAETRLHVVTAMIEVRTSELPDLAAGDTFDIGDDVYVVQGEPVRDSERLVWTAELLEA